MKLTIADLARYPRPGMNAPAKPAFSPDGRLLTFLWSESGSLARELWALDVSTGERCKLFAPSSDLSLSREEALRRERERIRETGVTHYAWAREANVLLIPIQGDVYVWRDGRVSKVASAATDPQITRDGRRVAFVRDGSLRMVDDQGERVLAAGGLAEFVAQEEMDRGTGFWLSPDGTKIAFEHFDASHIPPYPIVHQGKDAVEIEEHRYPFAGASNVRWRLGIVSVDGGPVRWLQCEGEYLARVAWHPDGRLFVETQTRDQRRLELWAYEQNGQKSRLLVEESPLWINLHDDLRFLEMGEFVWASERTGYKHLYLHDRDGRPIRPVTSGLWSVDHVVGLDQKRRNLYFAGGKESPLERQIYAVNLDGGEPRRVTQEAGLHDAVFSQDGTKFVDLFDSRGTPPTLTVRWADGKPLRSVHRLASIGLPAPELFQFANRDGITLYGAVYKPDRLPAPLIVSVYGGPHVQNCQDSWLMTVDLRAQLLAQRGFVVLKVDNRGSARRGLDFEGAIAGRMGTVEVQDQVDGVNYARSQNWVEADRIGIYGGSYGGYMTLMCLCKAPDVFKVGVAAAPVTDFAGYDTHYTERYMRAPQENPGGYRAASVMNYVKDLRGKLLLAHGMLDENVHFRHTARLIATLTRENKPYELLLYPNERHMPRGEKDLVNIESRIVEFFERNL